MYICRTGFGDMEKNDWENLKEHIGCFICIVLFIIVMWCLLLITQEIAPNAPPFVYNGIIFGIVIGSLLAIYFLIQIFGICCNNSSNEFKQNNVNQKNTCEQADQHHVSTHTYSTKNNNPKYPIIDEIQTIISNLSELETDSDLDKNMFVKFHVLKEQFDVDYQNTMRILNKLEAIKQMDEKHLRVFKHYLDLFKVEQKTIYDNIKQQYNDELNIINEKLHHFNDL